MFSGLSCRSNPPSLNEMLISPLNVFIFCHLFIHLLSLNRDGDASPSGAIFHSLFCSLAKDFERLNEVIYIFLFVYNAWMISEPVIWELFFDTVNAQSLKKKKSQNITVLWKSTFLCTDLNSVLNCFLTLMLENSFNIG